MHSERSLTAGKSAALVIGEEVKPVGGNEDRRSVSK